ncbi:hypothetical protein CUJ87_06495 [Paraburkholderia caledonica]|nr:hypothetical protein CUJ87_06495 [Paraburkholderia caledonica]
MVTDLIETIRLQCTSSAKLAQINHLCDRCEQTVTSTNADTLLRILLTGGSWPAPTARNVC